MPTRSNKCSQLLNVQIVNIYIREAAFLLTVNTKRYWFYVNDKINILLHVQTTCWKAHIYKQYALLQYITLYSLMRQNTLVNTATLIQFDVLQINIFEI